MTRSFEILSLNISGDKGMPKSPVPSLVFIADHGIEGDAHAGPGKRQVSLLADEDIETIREKLDTIAPGDFAENITTRGIDLASLPLGTRLTIGDVVLEISQIGKECHSGCTIREKTGDCVMPRRGIFAVVVEGGEITDEDTGRYGI